MASLITRWRNPGSTEAERRTTFPGDELVDAPADVVTLGTTVHAPAAVVWRWLVQIGQERGGMYSYDWLENLLGLDIHSADRVHDEWQHLAVGDRVVVVAPGKLHMPDGYSFPVARVEPDHCIVLRQCPPEHPWNAVWTFVLTPTASGCRLVSRSRSGRLPGVRGAAMRLVGLVMSPVTLVMTRRMLLGIKQRAETEQLLTDLDHLV